MKIHTTKTLLGSLALGGMLLALPLSSFAADASTTSAVRINGDGGVRVVNAEVTSVSGNLINAITRFKNSIANWTFTTNASSTVNAGANATSTSVIRVGDKLDISGMLSSLGATISVDASKILDLTNIVSWRSNVGTVQSVNTTNGTFVLAQDNGKTVTVQTNASTTLALSTATSTLANLAVGSKVQVTGTLNGDASILTATKVALKIGDTEDRKEHKDNNGASHGKKKGWIKQEERANVSASSSVNTESHGGLLKVRTGLGLDVENENELGR
jgi:hypothetical protein